MKRVAAERKALVKAGKIKRDKGESVIFRGSDRLAYETRNGETVCIQDEIPFDIPDSWEWMRLGDMSNYGQCTSVDTASVYLRDCPSRIARRYLRRIYPACLDVAILLGVHGIERLRHKDAEGGY